MFNRILIPLDGSALAELALPVAEAIAAPSGTPIHLLRIVDLTRVSSLGTFGNALEFSALEPLFAEEQQLAEDYLQEIAQAFAPKGLAVSTEVRNGVVARAVVEAMQPGDLTVMATHGRGGVSRWLLGSVAEDVLRHAPYPVLLVPAKTTQEKT